MSSAGVASLRWQSAAPYRRWKLRTRATRWVSGPLVVGVRSTTPDSFSDWQRLCALLQPSNTGFACLRTNATSSLSAVNPPGPVTTEPVGVRGNRPGHPGALKGICASSRRSFCLLCYHKVPDGEGRPPRCRGRDRERCRGGFYGMNPFGSAPAPLREVVL